MTVPPRLKVMDMAIGLTGQTPTSLNQNDPTVRVAMALVKLFQSVGLERGDNVAGDLQPTQFTDEKKNTLNILVQNITATEWKNGAYANILKPWLDVSPVSDTQAFELVTQLAHLSLVGLYQSDYITLAEPNLISENFYGCNLTNLADCPKIALIPNICLVIYSYYLIVGDIHLVMVYNGKERVQLQAS